MGYPSDLYEQILAEEAELRLDSFGVDDAWVLGAQMRRVAAERSLPVAIGIVLGQQRVFHAALPGSSADNDEWLARKTAVVLRYCHSSLAVGEQFRLQGKDFDVDGRLDTAVSVTIENGRITRLYAIRNPTKLARLAEVVTLTRA